MKIRFTLLLALAILFAAAGNSYSKSFPIGFSAKGGIGSAYYSMDELNDQIFLMRQSLGTNLSSIDNGFQVFVEGRIWFFDRYAALFGYEHYWVEAAMDAGSYTLTYKTPANVLVFGGVYNLFVFPKLLDLNIGARGTFAKVIYGSNETTETTRLVEFKNNDYGWDVFIEANTNFLRPVEVGMMLGYRNLQVTDLENKYQETAIHALSGKTVTVDYSGMFFYITAGIRLW